MTTDAVGVGIDLGVNGAVAVLRREGVTVRPLPLLEDRTLDAATLRRWLLTVAFEPIETENAGRFEYRGLRHFIVYESVFRPNSLVRLGGEVAATCKTVNVDHDSVPVVRWKRAVLGENTADKAVVIDWCKRTYPHVSLRRTPRARTDSHDYADAVALAHYAKGLLDGVYH